MRVIDSIKINSGLKSPYIESVPFMLVLEDELCFDGCEEGGYGYAWSSKLNCVVPSPKIEPMPEQEKLKCCIKA